MSAGYMSKCVNTRTNQPKQRHETQAEAEKRRESMISQGVWTRARSNTYLCNQCGFWHAGSIGRGTNRAGGRRKGAKGGTRRLDTQ